MFWGGERLKDELGALIDDYDVKRVDRAAYRLRVGGEVYVSPTGEPNDPRNKPKKPLGEAESFTIPAGQFGFILTEELIRVPQHAIAFISIRATYKFRGLVNVSGFHVDPHYEGKLLFSVFNAGPGAVHLSRGEECFLIWYASLDRPSVLLKKMGFETIPSDLLGPIATGVESFAGLKSKIDENDKKLSDRVTTVEREQAVMKWASALVIGAMITFGLKECSLSRPAVAPTSSTSSMVPSPSPTITPSPTASPSPAVAPAPAVTPSPSPAPTTPSAAPLGH
ncbi:deoxycytidine triphosphate deaminase [Rhizorhabdus sp.]|uniref:dCTP deaminase domain-containing protein n=1 Tax=Rhizorhabdus sp. TaxID=1968843 RepID=UPI0019A1F3AD|nr:deoxycytidine triphosphate deaminase [Rhizorhabdus sp.]MBD3761781.1 deoxycytidine triphosphate deaminase [Rhizorhabdus sp.]